MTSILKHGPDTRTIAASISTTEAKTIRPGSCDTGHLSLPMDIYIYIISCSRVLLFAFSTFHHDDLDFPDQNSNYTVLLE